MKQFMSLLASLLISVMIVGSAIAGPILDRFGTWNKVAEWAGCEGSVLLNPNAKHPDGHFGVIMGVLPVIIIDGPAITELSEGALTSLILHEAGHCIQYQEGRILEMSDLESEQGADHFGATKACELGLNAYELRKEVFELYLKYGPERTMTDPSASHGSFQERLDLIKDVVCAVSPQFQPQGSNPP